jgi:hypothetical protein
VGQDRPGSVTLSAVLLMAFGLILALFGFAFTVFGAMFGTLRLEPELVEELGPVPESAGGVILALGLVVLVWGSLEVVAAAFVLGRRAWARYAAIVVAILGTLAGLALSLPRQNGLDPALTTATLAFAGGHAFAIWALTRNGAWFSRA